MTQRERTLAVAVLSVIILGGAAFVGYHFFLLPLRQKDSTIANLRKDVEGKRLRLAEIERDRPKLELWRQLSLPPDVNRSHEYVSLLNDLLLKSGFPSESIKGINTKPADTRSSPTLPGRKEPIYTTLNFNVGASGSLANLVTLLENFYRTGLLHRIRSISVQRPLTTTKGDKPYQLDFTLAIEALIVQGAEERASLLPGIDRRLLAVEVAAGMFGAPAGLSWALTAGGPAGPQGPRVLAEPGRQYASIADKDVFFGPPPPPPPVFVKDKPKEKEKTGIVVDLGEVHLTDIIHVDEKVVANLYDRGTNVRTKLKADGDSSFKVCNPKGEPFLQGKVIRIEDRDVVFQVGTRVYTIHVGQSLKDSMAKATKEVMASEVKTGKEVKLPPATKDGAETAPTPREAPNLPDGR